MSTITKERLQRLICAIDSENYDEEEIVDWVNSDEIMELARIALASLEAEAAACPKCNGTGMADSGGVQPWGEPISIECDCTSPPAPVSVPDMATPQIMRTMFCQLDDSECAIAADVWNACRAALLKGTYGNSPVIPDGWVACSERMPEDTQMVLAFSHGEIVAAYWNYVMCPIEYKKYRAFTYLSGSRLDGVTHWMPLPPPPAK